MRGAQSTGGRASCFAAVLIALAGLLASGCKTRSNEAALGPRKRISINDGWRFTRGDPPGLAVNLDYDVRPETGRYREDQDADTPAVAPEERRADEETVLKPWILPSANSFINDPADRHERPDGNPGGGVPYVQQDFDDSVWERVNLPHDWAIAGPFITTGGGGGMGRLPTDGIGWYRRNLDIPAGDADKSIFLDIDGAMSYATVWLNGQLVGGWPYGYASWRVDLTPYVEPGGTNLLAIRLDNPPNSARWYPGAGLYRSVWLVKIDPVHVTQWGTVLTSRDIGPAQASVDLTVTIDNDSDENASVRVSTAIFPVDSAGLRLRDAVAEIGPLDADVPGGSGTTVNGSVTIDNPRLWGPPPTQAPNLYEAVTTVTRDGGVIDNYTTRFGIRDLQFDPDAGLFVNGEHVYIKGANQHHDLGALGGAFNKRAAERQLEILREMGANAIRTAHNPPAPELLELTDRMGFLVVDEIYDVWERRKTPLDFHLIFPEWFEPDTRAFVRRDRNHPSVIMWSYGNEVGEQYTDTAGAEWSKRLHDIVREEDPTRPTTASMNFAKPPMPFPGVPDVISLNYQGEGIRDAPAYRGMQGIATSPLYPSFHETHPDKLILSSENAAAVSSRGEYVFPVFDGISAPVLDGQGGDPVRLHVSGYELYTTPFGSSADKVFGSLERHPYVAGGFVWSGWDYLGEPTPYYDARSSYFGVIDLAGFPKNRFYLYQAHWRPDLPMAHILPHWTWPERDGEVTPVHVFTSGDEAELFLNGASLGRRRKAEFEYRLRWDDVVYAPGRLEVVAYRNGNEWARDVVETTGPPAALEASADRATIAADGKDLAFVTVRIVDEAGRTQPRANNRIRFSIDGPGEIVATDNGDPINFESFASHERAAFNGVCLVIVRALPGATGRITIRATSDGLSEGAVEVPLE